MGTGQICKKKILHGGWILHRGSFLHENKKNGKKNKN